MTERRDIEFWFPIDHRLEAAQARVFEATLDALAQTVLELGMHEPPERNETDRARRTKLAELLG